MKTIKFLSLLFASIAFAACTNDDNATPKEGVDDGTVVRNAWMSLSIKQSTGGTRALNDPDSENGTVNETNIKAVQAIFFKYTGGSNPVPLAQKAQGDFEVVDARDLSLAEIGTPGQGYSGVAGKAFKVSEDAEYVLLIANPTSNSLPASASTYIGKTFAEVNAAIEGATISDVIGVNKNYFMMTNAKGDLEPSVSFDDPALEKLDLSLTEIRATNNPVQIILDRVAAKVRVYYSWPASRAEQTYNVADVEWVLNVTNTTFYPVSERTLTNLNTTTWSDWYGLGSYRYDPNYTLAQNGTATYNTYNSNTDPTGITWNANEETEYCLENTQDKESNMQAYTTQVLLKVNLLPRNLSLAPETSLSSYYDVSQGQDWLTIGGVVFTYESLMEWMREELYAKYSDRDPDNFVTTLTTELNEYLGEVAGATKVTIPTEDAFNNDLADFWDKIDAIIQDFEEQEQYLTAGGISKSTNLNYYKSGMNYYKIMIKHDNDNDANNNELGEFGVVRNSVYDIRINSINNPGSPVIPTPNPDTPDEEVNNISFEIIINPWTWYSQEENL